MAKVTDTVVGQVERVRKFIDTARAKYKRAYEKALEQSRIGELGSELGKVADDIAPVIRSEVSKKIDVAQKWLDTVNQSLAEKALPEDRKKDVTSIKLKEKSQASSKAATGRKATAKKKATSKSSKTSTRKAKAVKKATNKKAGN